MSVVRRLGTGARALWRLLRALSGDDAYERYRAHQHERHPLETPLSRRAFYEQSQRRKWHGVSRCC
ncbi:MAG TPA: YbdD/YjiX family protein [Steroidobacteraceae bacterium]|nr:YbdD/YjiX family protein [Steroidobacteraceae bacterium]